MIRLLQTGGSASLALAVVLLSGCGTGSAPSNPVDAYRVDYPKSWAKRSSLPDSAYLSFLAVGHSSTPGCPDPLTLVRGQEHPNGPLATAVELYNAYEHSRRPGRRVTLEKPVSIKGASAAVLIEASYPAEGGRGRRVASFDLLARSDSDVAFHLFASGCGADLPPRFVERYILSFDADTLQ